MRRPSKRCQRIAIAAALGLVALLGGGTFPPLGEPSASTRLSVTVQSPLVVTAPAGPLSVSLRQGQSSSALSAPLSVRSYLAAGYRLSLSRSTFSRGDMPLDVKIVTSL